MDGLLTFNDDGDICVTADDMYERSGDVNVMDVGR